MNLERMGFGINELRILYNTLMEIGYENNIGNKTFKKIEKEFFDDLKNYGEVLSSRNEKERLQNEIKHLEMQIIKEKERYNSYPNVIDRIERLSNAGISENDIIAIDRIISMSGTPYQLNKDKARSIQNIMSDLQRYGNLKLAIKNLQYQKKIPSSYKKTQPQIQKPKKKNKSSTSKYQNRTKSSLKFYYFSHEIKRQFFLNLTIIY